MKAGIVKDIKKYLWSSYHEYTGTVSVVNIEFALDIFSEDRTKAIELFRAFTKGKNTDECLEYREQMHASIKKLRIF